MRIRYGELRERVRFALEGAQGLEEMQPTIQNVSSKDAKIQ
jgi:hypothetical protein